MNKYNAHKCYAFGIKFDSKAEMERYLYLRDRMNRGEITDLQCHRKFTLIKPQNYGKHRLQATTYIADFVYWENGKAIVEDVKGYKKGVAYQLFMIKKKMMLEKYGLWVREIE